MTNKLDTTICNGSDILHLSDGAVTVSTNQLDTLRQETKELEKRTRTTFEQMFNVTDALNRHSESIHAESKQRDARLEDRIASLEEDTTDLANQLGKLQMKHERFVESVVRGVTLAVSVGIIAIITWALV